MIIIESTWTTSDKGAAYAIAMRQHEPDINSASHFTVDETKIYQCVPAKRIAGSESLGIKNALVIRLCVDPPEVYYGWDTPTHKRLLDNLSDLVAQLTVEYKIRPRILTSAEYQNWNGFKSRRRGGIFAPLEVSWPKDSFLHTLHHKREEY